ncbi:MAG: hypothetical protein HQK83_03260 [Fibrobacteria bacterium]|nr:hypothetical protein [Fibrobacteria bacterium]
MNNSMLWIGILPVIAFLILDSYTDKKKALLGAIVLGLGEFIFTLIQFGSIDYLTVLTLLLLLVFVGISLKTNNDFYFKIQSAVVNIILALILIVSQYLFGKFILLDGFIKYVGINFFAKYNPAITKEITIQLLEALNTQLPWWLFIHSALTIYAAAKWNKWLWAIIRIPGLYIFLFFVMKNIAAGILPK